MAPGIPFREVSAAEALELAGSGWRILDVRELVEWNEVPAKFEAGTPAIVEAIGLGAAIDYLTNLGMDAVREHERYLFEHAWAALGEIPGVRRFGPDDPAAHAGVISFVLDGIRQDWSVTLQDFAIRPLEK